jgi:RNA ligase (TIGR02306 family)
MSELSRVFVRRITGLRDHPSADRLWIGEIDGLTFITSKIDGTKEGDLALVVPYEMECPNLPEIGEFIRGKRVKPMRLRGIFSMAVLLPNCWNFDEGFDATDVLKFTKWEPFQNTDDGVELQNSGNGQQIRAPFELLHYDINNLRKYHKEFNLGENVLIQEKIHGENTALCWHEDQLKVRSRTRWIQDGPNKWYEAARLYDWSFLKEYPNLVLFGEKYGNVNKYRYDCKGDQRIAIFDVYDWVNRRFFTINEFLDFTTKYDIVIAPILYKGEWQGIDTYKAMAEENSTWGGHIREGFVVRGEGVTDKFERRIWKFVSERYLLANNKI